MAQPGFPTFPWIHETSSNDVFTFFQLSINYLLIIHELSPNHPLIIHDDPFWFGLPHDFCLPHGWSLAHSPAPPKQWRLIYILPDDHFCSLKCCGLPTFQQPHDDLTIKDPSKTEWETYGKKWWSTQIHWELKDTKFLQSLVLSIDQTLVVSYPLLQTTRVMTGDVVTVAPGCPT